MTVINPQDWKLANRTFVQWDEILSDGAFLFLLANMTASSYQFNCPLGMEVCVNWCLQLYEHGAEPVIALT